MPLLRSARIGLLAVLLSLGGCTSEPDTTSTPVAAVEQLLDDLEHDRLRDGGGGDPDMVQAPNHDSKPPDSKSTPIQPIPSAANT